jgi:histidine kinase/DNA gyrase B/HSP90-like ATPase
MAMLKAMEVDNIDFLIEKMGQDCAPLQYLRELTQNAIEAIQRTGRSDGHIVWDHFVTSAGVRKLCIVDNGDGMTGVEMMQYINKLSSSRSEQGMTGNYGVGAKIAAAVHSPAGLVYVSRPDHDDEKRTYSIQLMRAEGKYGLLPYGEGSVFEYFATLDVADIPEHLRKYGSGTSVIISGKTDDADTAAGPVDQWVRKYLNTRYFTIPRNIKIQCRDARQAADGEDIDFEHEKKVNGLRSVHGQKWMLDGASLHKGVVELSTARAHWWILPADSGKFDPPLRLANAPKPITSMQTFHPAFNHKGHVALIYRNQCGEELLDVPTRLLHGYHRLQTFGVILGMSQVVIYIEPTKGSFTTDTARTRMIINGQDPPWNEWAEEFKAAMPASLADFIESFDIGKSERSDDAVREKVKEMLPLFALPRFRKTDQGSETADAKDLNVLPPRPDAPSHDDVLLPPTPPNPGARPRPLLGHLKPGVAKGTLVNANDIPHVDFLYGERAAEIMSDDIAAHYVSPQLVQANGNFRVFQFLLDYFAKQYGDAPGVRKKILPILEYWVTVHICDVVLGLRAMGSLVWTQSKIDERLRDDEGLTMALVPRILLSQVLKREVHREVGRPAEEGSDRTSRLKDSA